MFAYNPRSTNRANSLVGIKIASPTEQTHPKVFYSENQTVHQPYPPQHDEPPIVLYITTNETFAETALAGQ